MSQLLYFIVEKIAVLHNWLMSLNDQYGFFLSDKWLHFLVMGGVGLAMLLVIHPLFTWLSENGHTLIVTWIYVFTVMIVLTFAIEIGQGISGTGTMEMEDVVAGMAGFLAVFVVFALIRALFHTVRGKH